MRAGLSFAAFVTALILVSHQPCRAVDIQRVDADGIEAWLVEDHANPIIAVRIGFRGVGAATDPLNKAGLANMVSGLLDEGAGDLDSQAFQGRLDELAIRFGFDASLDDFGGSFQTQTEHRDAAFDLLRLALTRPRFDVEPLDRIRAQVEAGLRRDQEDPETVASRRLFAALFPDHPYGRSVEGTLASLPGIDRRDLQRFVSERLGRDNLVVGVVGDITPAQLAPLLATTFDGLPAKALPAAIADVAVQGHGTTVIDMSVPQSAIAFAQPGLKRDDPRFYTLTVLDQILGGGGLSSRLFDEVREKRGLVYSVYTALVPLDHAALVIGGAATANARVAETLEVVRNEWTRVGKFGVTPEELADSKTFLTGSYPLRFAGSGRLAGMLVAIQLDSLGIDYANRRNALIEAVSLEEVNRMADQLLHTAQLSFVVVGQPKGLTPAP